MTEPIPEIPDNSDADEIVLAESVLASENPPQPMVPYPLPERPKNTTGLVGLILAIIGLVAVGFLTPVAVVVSIVGLRKKPRELAVAGFIISAFASATLFWSIVFTYFVFSNVTSIQQSTTNMIANNQTRMSIQTEAWEIGQLWKESGQPPNQAEGDKLIGLSTDAWNNAIYYELESDQQSFRLRSYGADGMPDTIDDVVVGPFNSPDEVTQY